MRELSLHVLDVVENSLAAGATHITLEIDENLQEDRLTIAVTDNGHGMDAETVNRALDPFYTTRTTRHVGLGLPLFKAAAERCNGRLVLESAPGDGTRVQVSFQRSHIDRAPLGNMVSTLLGILLAERVAEVRYVHRVGDQQFGFDTEEIRRTLGGVSMSHPLVQEWLQGFLTEGEAGVSDGQG